MTEQLNPLPCPFCGNKALIQEHKDIVGHSTSTYRVKCADHECIMNDDPGWFEINNAVNQWNTRAYKQCDHDWDEVSPNHFIYNRQCNKCRKFEEK